MAEADRLRNPELDVWQAYENDRDLCEAWHDHRAPESAALAVNSEIPVLIFAGEFDPITPPAFGRLAADTLPRSTFVEVQAIGHGVVPYTDCTMNIMEAFLDRPSGPQDLNCVAAIAPISFTTDVHLNAGIYRLTKQVEESSLIRALGFGLVILILLSAVVVWPLIALVRRIRRRPQSMPAGAVKARWLAAITSLLGLAFIVTLGAVIVATAQDNPYSSGIWRTCKRQANLHTAVDFSDWDGRCRATCDVSMAAALVDPGRSAALSDHCACLRGTERRNPGIGSAVTRTPVLTSQDVSRCDRPASRPCALPQRRSAGRASPCRWPCPRR